LVPELEAHTGQGDRQARTGRLALRPVNVAAIQALMGYSVVIYWLQSLLTYKSQLLPVNPASTVRHQSEADSSSNDTMSAGDRHFEHSCNEQPNTGACKQQPTTSLLSIYPDTYIHNYINYVSQNWRLIL